MQGAVGKATEHASSTPDEGVIRLLRQRVCGFAVQRGCRAPEAEDVAQDTLTIIVEKYSDKQPEELIKLATVICMNLIRNRRRRRSEQNAELPEETRDASSGPEELMSKSEIAQAIARAIEKNSTAADKALLRAELRGDRVEDICSTLRISANTLYSRRNRCYKRLRNALTGFR